MRTHCVAPATRTTHIAPRRASTRVTRHRCHRAPSPHNAHQTHQACHVAHHTLCHAMHANHDLHVDEWRAIAHHYAMPHDDTRHDDANANAFTSPQALARRVAYDNAMATMPLTNALRALRVPTSPTSGRTTFTRTPRVHHDTTMPDGPNDWETNAPRPSPGCHKHECPDQRLVKCHHRW